MTDRSLKFTAFLTIACIGLLSSAPLAGMDLLPARKTWAPDSNQPSPP